MVSCLIWLLCRTGEGILDSRQGQTGLCSAGSGEPFCILHQEDPHSFSLKNDRRGLRVEANSPVRKQE